MFANILLDGHLAGSYPYRLNEDLSLTPGDWVVVPWGKSRRVGIVATVLSALPPDSTVPLEKIRPLERRLDDLPTLPGDWFDLIRFAAGYYHAQAAELALAAIPKLLRTVPTRRTRVKAADRLARFDGGWPDRPVEGAAGPMLSEDQQQVLDTLPDGAPGPSLPSLIQGVTGSGKTEVYLRWIERILAGRPDSQVLVLVPEIGLTPAFHQQLCERFAGRAIAVLHSEMSDAARASNWLAAASGAAAIVLGTRLAALTPVPQLAAIVVDEEHDPSFKQQEGVRYSARDLAIARAARRAIPIVLGSATPSLESWGNARSGRYRLLRLARRATGTALPKVTIVSLQKVRLQHGLTPTAIAAIQAALERREQALLFLNRRGYAPVLTCASCQWLSHCDQCDAYRVLHRQTPAQEVRTGATPGGSTHSHRYRLVCHHCGADQPVPTACPDCGNQDLTPLGRGTQRIEEGLASLFPTARVARLDRDVASRKGATQRFLASAHAGDVDLMIGTQMLAKGHDFERLTLVVVIDADAGLFAADFRAPERLFATLMQVSGRAGRHREQHAATLVQTRFPDHPLFDALVRQDYEGFANRQLAEREASGLPPSTHQTLLLAQARDAAVAIGFLQQARALLETLDEAGDLTMGDPVPMPLAQLRGQARAQLLVESVSRPRLHRRLADWTARLGPLAATVGSGLRWTLVVDPAEI